MSESLAIERGVRRLRMWAQRRDHVRELEARDWRIHQLVQEVHEVNQIAVRRMYEAARGIVDIETTERIRTLQSDMAAYRWKFKQAEEDARKWRISSDRYRNRANRLRRKMRKAGL